MSVRPIPGYFRNLLFLITVLISTIFSFTPNAQCPSGNIIYVKATAPAGGNGQSWATAYNELQKAISSAAGCTTPKQIWVAQGTYYPTEKPWNATSADSRDLAFYLRNNQTIYGGFTGTETTLAARNPAINKTTLSGNIGTSGNSDNCYHVVANIFNNTSAVLDGVTVADGNANGTGSLSVTIGTSTYAIDRTTGGGMINLGNAQPVISSVIFSGNNARHGGGVCNNASTPRLYACVFYQNAAVNWGGGVYNLQSSPETYNCVFAQNTSEFGGGILNESASPEIFGCTFYGNAATSNGGGIRNYGAAPVITNTIIWGNTGGGTQGIYSSNGSDTTKVSYSNLQGPVVYGGTGNKNTNPLFVNTGNIIGADGAWLTADDGLRLPANSPSYQSASNTAAFTVADIAGDRRIQDAIAEMGAYEYKEDTTRTRIYVDVANATGIHDGKSWGTAFNRLENGITVATLNDSIWVANGIYYRSNPGQYFQMKSGVKMYGGFAGNETVFSQRNVAANICTIAGNGERAFKNNGVIDGLLDGFTMSAIGGVNGGVFNDQSKIDLKNVSFSNCTSSDKGGAILNKSNSDVKIINCNFKTCFSSNGGAIYNENGLLDIRQSQFDSNKATGFGYGGAIYIINSDVQIKQTYFNYNTAYWGGGIYTEENNKLLRCKLDSVQFAYNKAKIFGGGLCSFGNVSVDSALFQYNRVDSLFPSNITPEPLPAGGGICIFGQSVSSSFLSTIDLKRLSILHNYSSHAGGGIALMGYTDSADVSLTGSFLLQNYAYQNGGGGIYAATYNTYTQLKIKNTIIRENEAQWASPSTTGGGMLFKNINPLIINTVIEENKAGSRGGGVYISNSSPSFINVNFLQNLAKNSFNPGHQYYSDEGSYTYVTNSIILDEVNNYALGTISIRPGFDINTYCLSKIYDLNLSLGNNNNVLGNPSPIGNTTGYYTPDACNIVINRGNASALPADITTDLYGNPRIINGYVDIGAVENTAVPDTFYFAGNGNWNTITNWQCNWVPPSTLPVGKKVTINPAAGGNCLLNQNFTVSPGAELRVLPGKELRVQPGINLVVPSLKTQ